MPGPVDVPTTPTPATTPPPDAIAAARAELARKPGDSDTFAKVEAAYKVKYGTGEAGSPPPPVDPAKPPVDPAAPVPPPTPPLDVPPVPLELEGEHVYDRDALAELGGAVASAEIPPEEMQMWIKVGHGQLIRGEHRSTEECYATLDKRFGEEKADAMVTDALAVLGRLTKPTREAVDRWLDETGLTNHPAFIEWLAGVGTRLRAAGGK
jgi:hypothetical protein